MHSSSNHFPPHLREDCIDPPRPKLHPGPDDEQQTVWLGTDQVLGPEN